LIRARCFAAVAGLAVGLCEARVSRAAESVLNETGASAPEAPEPRLIGGGSGRFEVIAEPGPEALRLAELAENAWLEWREPLGLPSRLPTTITVRLVPMKSWRGGERRHFVAAGHGGVVTVWIRGDAGGGLAAERAWLGALAEGVLKRKSVLLGGSPDLEAPAWLAEAAAEAAIFAARPAMLDAWQAEMRREEAPARLREVLIRAGEAGAGGGRGRSLGAAGVWLWLRGEGLRNGAWARFLDSVLLGESPGGALAREYASIVPAGADAREWELAWRVAAARLAAAQQTPVLEPAEARRRIERLGRLVVFDVAAGGERVQAPVGEWQTRREAWPAGERRARAAFLAAELPRMHPFYRNAAVSLGRAWQALAEGREGEWREAGAEWGEDWAAGRALEAASARLLDEAEAR
jgi:hypothetical protein